MRYYLCKQRTNGEEGMYKNTVENDKKYFNFPALLSCKQENSAENRAEKFKIYK